MGIFDNPFVVFAVALVVQWGGAYTGDLIRKECDPSNRVNGTILIFFETLA
jgi:hypothetical protein